MIRAARADIEFAGTESVVNWNDRLEEYLTEVSQVLAFASPNLFLFFSYQVLAWL